MNHSLSIKVNSSQNNLCFISFETLSNKQLTRLKRLNDRKTGISLRGISTTHRCLKAMGIGYRKKKRAPKYTDKQLEEIPKRVARLCQTDHGR